MKKEIKNAEKAHAIILMGEANSRLKDFYDIWLLSENLDFDGAVLQQALQKTFQRRQTNYPGRLSGALTPEFANDNQKNWERMVIGKNKLTGRRENDLAWVVDRLTEFFMPPLNALAGAQPFTQHWKAGEGWLELEQPTA